MIDAETLAQVPLIDSETIHTRYRALVREWLPETGLVLKTDAYNEANGGFRHLDRCGLEGRTVYVEYDPETMAIAKGKHPEKAIVHGDIRDLRFPSDMFHAVVDLSTIDHVQPSKMPFAISDYYRVLRPDGVLILVVWCKPDAAWELSRSQLWDPEEQYYWPGDPRDLLGLRFECVHEGWICRRGDTYLAGLVARPVVQGALSD